MFSTVQKQSSFEFLEVPDVPGSEGATSSSKEVRSYTVVFEYDTFRVRFLWKIPSYAKSSSNGFLTTL